MVDTTDLKSVALKGVWVRLPPSAPLGTPRAAPCVPILFYLFLHKSLTCARITA